MASARDYEMVAEILRVARRRYSKAGFGPCIAPDFIRDSLADYFASDNHQFDRERFLKAAGLTEEN